MKQKIKRKKTPYKWLRDLIGSIDFGKERENSAGEIGCPHVNTKADILAAFNNGQWWRLKSLRNADFDDHFDGQETYFFTAGRGGRTLILIDVDCKRTGSPEGAKAFCDFLAQSSFPGLYHEPSRSGKGRHGYLVLETEGAGAAVLNDLLLHRLQPRLDELAKDFDVEFVEIKGTFPVFDWSDERGKLDSIRCGCLGKLPKDVSRFNEWQETTVVRFWDLMKLPVPPKRTKARVDESEAPPRLQFSSPAGSCSGVPVTEAELERLPEYIELANNLLGETKLRTTGRHVVTAEDVAIFLMLGKCFTENMNADGSMPRTRFEAVWSILKGNGHVARPFCRKRFKVIRDFLSQNGLLDWRDETYRPSTVFDEQGKGLNGVACKWQFSDQLMEMLTIDNRGRESILGGTYTKEETVILQTGSKSTYTDLEQPLFCVPRRVYDEFDHLLAAERIDKVVKNWSPAGLLAA